MVEKFLGENIKKLGFGFMRLPMNGQEIDIEQTKRMVDTYMSKGFTYFDTAYVYIGGKSEVAIKEAVTDRYPRDSFQVASKLPLWMCEKSEDMQKYFDESCQRAGIDFYDFYLMHAMDAGRIEAAEKLKAWDFMKELKAQGKVKHIGFSFHDSAEVLETALKKYPETEFVQLQINYADWEDEKVQARECYELAMKYDVPVIVMEPVKGGSLAALAPSTQQVFKDANPDASVASWAMRYAASFDKITTVLSGMSNEEQLNDNVSFMEDFVPLNDEERKVVAEVVEILDNTPTIPCTTCKYCVDGCPQSINIPGILGAMNTYTLYDNLNSAKGGYNWSTNEGGKASACIDCGACEEQCPQHIDIMDELKKASSLFE